MDRPTGRMFLPLLALLLGACVTVRPVDVQPFADQTAQLRQRMLALVDTLIGQYRALAGPARSRDARKVRQRLLALRAGIAAWTRALQAYADSLAELERAGHDGGAAARRVAANLRDLIAPFGVSLPLGAGAARLVGRIGQAITRVQAQRSLSRATALAQPAIDDIMLLGKRLFNACYGMSRTCPDKGLQGLTRLLARQARRRALNEAGPTLIGFYRNARITRMKLYLQLNRDTRLPVGRTTGYCVRENGTLDRACLRQFDQLGLLERLERRIAAVEPVWRRYREAVARIDRRERRLLNTQRTLMRALSAWARAHERIRRSLAGNGRVNLRELQLMLRELRRE